MLGLLGFMAAGGAQGYRDAKNAEVDTHNKMVPGIISAEMNEMYQAQRDKRLAERDEANYQRTIQREDEVYSRKKGDEIEKEKRERGYKLEDFTRSAEHDMKKMDLKHKSALSIEGIRQAGADKRARMRADGLLNSSGSPGGKDLEKSIDADHKRLLELNEKLHSPMTRVSPEMKRIIEDEIMRIQSKIDSRFNLDDIGL